MSKSKLEKDEENAFVLEANKNGFYVLKLVLLGRRGWPDRTILGNGMIFFIEFKRGKNILSGPQRHWKRIIEAAGLEYYVCYTEKEAMKILKRKSVTVQGEGL